MYSFYNGLALSNQNGCVSNESYKSLSDLKKVTNGTIRIDIIFFIYMYILTVTLITFINILRLARDWYKNIQKYKVYPC